MSAEFSIRNGQDVRELSGADGSAWAGAGATALGLTGQVHPADFEALADLVADDEDQDDEVGSYEAQAAGGVSLIEQMRPRRHTVALLEAQASAASGSSISGSGEASGPGISGSEGFADDFGNGPLPFMCAGNAQ